MKSKSRPPRSIMPASKAAVMPMADSVGRNCSAARASASPEATPRASLTQPKASPSMSQPVGRPSG